MAKTKVRFYFNHLRAFKVSADVGALVQGFCHYCDSHLNRLLWQDDSISSSPA